MEKELNQKQELLLCKYSDCECSFWENLLARKLISSNSAAKEFLKLLERNADCVRNTYPTELSGSSGFSESSVLWEKIATRIEQEERAELFSGAKRGVAKDRSHESKSNSSLWWGGLSGAFVAAGTIFVLMSQAPEPGQQLALSNPATKPAEFAAIAGKRPVIIERGIGSAVQVDWMRGDGRVQMMQDSSNRTAMIWVTRGNPSARKFPNRKPVISEPSLPQAFVAGNAGGR